MPGHPSPEYHVLDEHVARGAEPSDAALWMQMPVATAALGKCTAAEFAERVGRNLPAGGVVERVRFYDAYPLREARGVEVVVRIEGDAPPRGSRAESDRLRHVGRAMIRSVFGPDGAVR